MPGINYRGPVTLTEDADKNAYREFVKQKLLERQGLRVPMETTPVTPAPMPAERDFSPELAAAKAQRNEMQLFAGLGKAGSVAGAAIAGVKPTHGGADELDAASERPVEDVAAMKAADVLSVASRRKSMVEDPTSPYSRQQQQLIKRLFPTVARDLGPDLERLSAAQLESRMPQFGEGQKARVEDVDKSIDHAQKERELDINDFKAHQTTQAGGLTDRDKNIQGRAEANWLIAYGKEVKPYRGIVSMMNEIEKRSPGLTRGRAPADGSLDVAEKLKTTLPAGLGAQISEPQKVALRSAVKMLYDYIRRPPAGANLTPQEEAYYGEVFQSALGAPPEVQAAILDLFRRDMGRQVESISAPYKHAVPGDVWQDAVTRGLVAPEAGLFQEEAPKAAPPPPRTAPSPFSTAPHTPSAAPAAAPKIENVKQIGGKTYIKVDGEWLEK